MLRRFLFLTTLRALLLGLVVSVVACGGGASPSGMSEAALSISATTQVFDTNQDGRLLNLGRWYSYQQSADDCDTGIGFTVNRLSPAACFVWLSPTGGTQGQWVRSSGPWWVDPNHDHRPDGDGFGLIHVLAFAQLPAAQVTAADISQTVVHFRASLSENFSTVVADSRLGPRQGHVYFWFQTAPRPVAGCTPDDQTGEDCTRQSDYILIGDEHTSHAVDAMGAAHEADVRLTLTALPASHWACLGHGLNVKYDCLPIQEALQQASVVGFVMAPVAPCPTSVDSDGMQVCDLAAIAASPSRYFAQGTFSFKDFRIERTTLRHTDARPLSWSLRAASPVLWNRWLAPKRSLAMSFDSGSGIYTVINGDTRAFRIGLIDAGMALDSANSWQAYYQPAGTDGQALAQLNLVAPDTDSTEIVRQVSVMAPGDNISILVDGDQLLFLRNDEVFFSIARPCAQSKRCALAAFLIESDTAGASPNVLVH